MTNFIDECSCRNCEICDIGELAEDLVKTLATKNNIISTPPKKDARGWDFDFEFDYNTKKTNEKKDLEENFNSKIQVKGFKSDYKLYQGRDITLRNINYMIKSNLPWFVFFVDTNNEDFYIVHFDNEMIKHGWNRIKKSLDKNEDLNKKTMKINPNNINKSSIVKLKKGDCLKHRLNFFIGNTLKEYENKKHSFKESIHYNEDRIIAKIKVNINELRNCELGYEDEVDPIHSKLELITPSGKVKEIKSNFTLSKLKKLSNLNTENVLFKFKNKTMSATLNISSFNLTDEVRLFGKSLDILISKTNSTITFDVLGEKKISLSKLKEELVLFKNIFSGNSSFSIAFSDIKINYINIHKYTKEFEDLFDRLNITLNILGEFNFDLNKEISLDELYSFWNQDSFSQYFYFIKKKGFLKIEKFKNYSKEKKDFIVLMPFNFKIFKLDLISYLSLICKSSISDDIDIINLKINSFEEKIYDYPENIEDDYYYFEDVKNKYIEHQFYLLYPFIKKNDMRRIKQVIG